MFRAVPVLFLFVLSCVGSELAHAQQPTRGGEAPLPVGASPSQELLLAELDKRRPDESSPFFALREEAAFFISGEGLELADARRVAVYPNTAGQNSVVHLFQQFGRDFAKFFRFGKEDPGGMTGLEVIPGTSFRLEDRREITASLSVTNHGNQLLALEFPTVQRFEFVIRDLHGAVIGRWSDDRSFAQEQGVIMVNPGEHIEYSATLSTREMQAGQTYLLEGNIAGHAQFTREIELAPY